MLLQRGKNLHLALWLSFNFISKLIGCNVWVISRALPFAPKDVGSYARCRSTRFECHMLSKVKEIALDELQSAHVKPSEGDD